MTSYPQYEDPELIALMQQDDREAFTVLYHRYWKLLFAVAVNKLHSIEDAEELVQDVFTSLWHRRKALSIEVSLKSYLAGAVKLKVYTLLAQKYRQRERQQQLEPAGTATTLTEELDLKDLLTRIGMATAKLPERCRLVYQLSREKGLSHKEIAGQLSISEKTVENQVTKALKMLKAALRSSFFTFLSLFL